MKEKELKSLIPKTSWDKIENYLNTMAKARNILQVNYYYDTECLKLHTKGNTLRIRQVDSTLKLQYKYNKQQNNKIIISEEYECQVGNIPICIESPTWLGDIYNSNVYESNLLFNYVGTLVTDRFNYQIGDAIISLDKNYYWGQVDYELEIEALSETSITNVYKLLNITNLSSICMSKYSRFATKLKHIRSINENF